MDRPPRVLWLAASLLLVAATVMLTLLVGSAPRVGAASEVVLVDPISFTVSEPSGQGAFTITLTMEPTATVTVGLTITSTECTVDPGILLLTEDNWATGASATVTAQDDAIADGPQICRIGTDAVISDDPNFGGEDPDNVVVTVTDDDTAGFSLTPTALSIAEPDGSATFTLSLTSQPTASVSVALSASSTECSIDPESLTLTPLNWSSGLSATVTAVDDALVDGDQACDIVTDPAVSADTNYGDQDPDDLPVTVTDDDTAGFSLSPTALSIAEPDGSADFSISLTSQPTDTVSIGLSASNSQCSVTPATITLTESNWNTGAPATVVAIDDLIADGSQTCLIQTASAFSNDPNYNTEDPPDLTVNVTDDDVAGFDVSPLSLSVGEPDGSADFVRVNTSSTSCGSR